MRFKILRRLKRKIYLEVDGNRILKGKYGVLVFYSDDFKTSDNDKTFFKNNYELEKKINKYLRLNGATFKTCLNNFDEIWDYSDLDIKLNKEVVL